MIKQMNVSELKSKLDKKESFILVDVREPDEYEICRIEAAKLIPLSQFQARAPQELPRDAEIVVHCHHGGRSQKACQYLSSLGYPNLANVAGGIHAWAEEIDHEMEQY